MQYILELIDLQGQGAYTRVILPITVMVYEVVPVLFEM